MSHNKSEANQIARGLEELPMETLEVTVWLEKARGELAACAPMVRRRPVMAQPRRRWLACCKATAEVRRVLGWVRLG